MRLKRALSAERLLEGEPISEALTILSYSLEEDQPQQKTSNHQLCPVNRRLEETSFLDSS